jgi:flagellar hook-associated protein 1 FlgK
VVQAYVNTALSKTLVAQTSTYAKQQTIANYLGDYSDAYGGTSASSTTISSSLDSMTSTLQALEQASGDATSASQLISTAQLLASQLNDLSSTVQDAREQASDAIATSVGKINTYLKTIETLNSQITQVGALGASAADLEDQRQVALQGLSEEIGIQYFVSEQNQVSIYSTGGELLLGAKAATLSYDAPGSLSASATYPGGIPGITLNGKDITTNLGNGTLGALVTLRDTTLPAEQEKLDAFAATLADTFNRVLAQGSSVPAPTTLTGTVAVDGAGAFAGSGSWRVAVVDSSGVVQSYADLDLSAYATVNDLVAALNGISGVSASIGSDGMLSMTSTDGSGGIALSGMDSDVGGRSASAAFGFNALFTGDTAQTIAVNKALVANSSLLATATLSDDAGLSVGDVGLVNRGGIIGDLLDALGSAQSFPSAGNFSARTVTLASYASSLIADAASQASAAQTLAETAADTYTYLSEKLANETGVNLDEETANMTQIQASYEASATLLATLRELFDTLINAVS